MITNHSNIRLLAEPSTNDFHALVSSYYDWVLEYNIKTDKIEFLHISDTFFNIGFIPKQITTFSELNALFLDKMVVLEEKEPYLEQLSQQCILDEINSKGCYVRTVHINTTNGINAESLRITPINNVANTFLVSLSDISMILDRDWMTDEYSRSGFITKVEQLLKEPDYQKGYSVLYTNISGFKAINEILGTHHGDMIIFQTCSSILDELKPVTIARLESDHFAALVKTTNISDEIMSRLCCQCYNEGTKRIPYVIKCGIYNIAEPKRKVAYMIDQAKLAEESIPADQSIPYAICNDQLRKNYVDQRVYVAELDSALKKGEFIPYYQPIVDAMTYEIVSAEALIRWNHSERGLIPPGLFIPVFEKEGLTSKLANYMINRILDFNNQRIAAEKKPIPCSVNLSRVDFYDTNLLDFLKDELTKHKNVSEMLKLEITESAYVTLESGAFSFLEEMKKINLSVLLDDFGSGMSALSTLELYDFDIIKLDMGFIRKIGKNPKTEAIIRHTIGLAHAMGAKVVAEGVETKEQLEFLQSVDCDMIQGYYFYKPMPVEEFEKLI